MEKSFDTFNKADDNLIELKIPINNAYQIANISYERYDGQIEYNKILYKYVYRKVYNDTVYLKCIPDHKRMQLENEKEEILGHTGENIQDKKDNNSHHHLVKNVLSDYEINGPAYLNFYSDNNCLFSSNSIDVLLKGNISNPYLPPEV